MVEWRKEEVSVTPCVSSVEWKGLMSPRSDYQGL